MSDLPMQAEEPEDGHQGGPEQGSADAEKGEAPFEGPKGDPAEGKRD